MSHSYQPDPISSNDPAEIVAWMQRELDRISNSIEASLGKIMHEVHVAPTRPREGQTEFADGTDWNPGGGRGVYTYYSGNWNKLG